MIFRTIAPNYSIYIKITTSNEFFTQLFQNHCILRTCLKFETILGILRIHFLCHRDS